MTMNNNSLAEIISTFSQSYINHFKQQHQHLPMVEQDSDWISPCETGEADKEGNIQWQPVAMDVNVSFDNVEKALEVELHPDIKTYFSQIYSESIPASCSEGKLELLFAWNKDDFERLQQNLIGHVLMKRRLKQELTVFFAVTDAEEINLVIHNQSGEVWAEPVGCEPNKKLANNLSEFFQLLSLD